MANRFARYLFPAVFFLTLAAVVYLWLQPRGGGLVSPGTSVRLSASRQTALVRAVERVAPTVVGVSSIERARGFTPYQPMEDLFLREFWSDVAPLGSESDVPRLGSGIVIDSRGFFLTNDHLVGPADEIWVTLADGRQFEAIVIGSDRQYDLAVIRVKEQDQIVFDTSPIGSSEDLMVGEWVVAVGNPYGYLLVDPKPSVTAGVISALHRDVRVPGGGAIYKDMIQTDASINPGNSGGPLVNADGRVIGINTFIFSQGGGSLGIGFAIPVNNALEIAEELILYGRVRGVWTGVFVLGLNELAPAGRRRLGVEDTQGVVVWTLEQGSPAEQSGIRLGDIIRLIGEERVATSEEAQGALFGARVGDVVSFTLQRGGETLKIPVTLEQLPDEGLQGEVP